MKKFLLISTLLFLFSCGNGKGKESAVICDVKEFPIVIDTLPENLTTRMQFGQKIIPSYDPYYFGVLKDTLFVGRSIYYLDPFFLSSDLFLGDSSRNHWNKFNGYYESSDQSWGKVRKKRREFNGKIEIEIDTCQIIKKCYPIFITNRFMDTISIGDATFGVGLMMQAMNEYCNWQNIEYLIGGRCGTGIVFMVLPPSESVVVLAPIYNGEYVTKFRIKMGRFYSNQFLGTINKNHFF